MAKKFIIKDEDGKQFEVTEETIDEEPEKEVSPVDEKIETKPEVKDDEGLTAEEIAALKALAARSADIIKLLDVEAKEHEAVSDDEEIIDEDIETEDADTCSGCGKPKDECVCDEDEKETVIETKTGDSKKSIGAIQKRTIKTEDSLDDRENAIAQAWADRFKKSYGKGE